MVQKLQTRDINLRYLIDNFGLQRVRNQEFFREWQENLPEVTDTEKQLLDRIQNIYYNLVDSPPVLENAVKLTIISPILFIADLFESPFQVKAEKSIAIQAEDEGRIIEGRIDILIMKANLWVTVIESKQLAFSTDEALAQLLTYSTFQVSEVHNRGRDTAVPCPYGNRRAIGVYFINVESAVYAGRSRS